MSLISCPDCKAKVSYQAEKCPSCGRVIKQRQTAGGLLAAVILGLLGAYAVYWFLANS